MKNLILFLFLIGGTYASIGQTTTTVYGAPAKVVDGEIICGNDYGQKCFVKTEDCNCPENAILRLEVIDLQFGPIEFIADEFIRETPLEDGRVIHSFSNMRRVE